MPSTLRLVGGSAANQGRVEVKRYGEWTSLCHYNFGMRAAAVACRQAGFIGGSATLEKEGKFGDSIGGGVYIAWDIYCNENSNTLAECGNFYQTEAQCAGAAVTCWPSKGETVQVNVFLQAPMRLLLPRKGSWEGCNL